MFSIISFQWKIYPPVYFIHLMFYLNKVFLLTSVIYSFTTPLKYLRFTIFHCNFFSITNLCFRSKFPHFLSLKFYFNVVLAQDVTSLILRKVVSMLSLALNIIFLSNCTCDSQSFRLPANYPCE